MNSRIVLMAFIFNITLMGSIMVEAKIIQKISYYLKNENIEQAGDIAAVMRIIVGEADFNSEKLVLGDVRLHYPKNPDLPITTAFAKTKVSVIEFNRPNDKSNWGTAIMHTGRGKNNEFEAHLPRFNSKDFDQLKLIFSKTGIEDREDNDQTDNNDKIRYHKVHVFYYIFNTKNGKIVDVAFEVEKNIYKLGDECPKHFSRVLIKRR